MKKIVSKILAVAMILGMFGVMPAKAETEELYPDYVPAKELPASIMRYAYDADKGEYRSGERGWMETSRNCHAINTDPNFDGNKKKTDWGTAGSYSPRAIHTLYPITGDKITQEGEDFGKGTVGGDGMASVVYVAYNPNNGINYVKLDNSKNYVFRVYIKDNYPGEGEAPLVNFAISNDNVAGRAWSKEYGAKGFRVTGEYQAYAGTFDLPDNFNNDGVQTISSGFMIDNGAGESISFKTGELGDVYFGEEVAFDISNSLKTPEEDVCQGEDIEVKAEVLNQGGKAGYLAQNFNWVALNEEKTEEAEGFTFKEGKDGEATVTIASEVPVGRYAIVAISEDYDGFIKTLYVDVLPERIKDTVFDVGEKPASVIKDSTEKTSVKATDSAIITTSFSNNNTVVTATAKTDIANTKNMGMDGLEIHPAFNGFASGFNFEAGKTYAFSAMVRKSAGSLADTDVYFNVAIGQGTEDTLSYTNEYGEDGMKLTDDWQKFAATITVSENYDSSNTSARHLYMGMPNGTLKDCAFDMKLDADYYLAENKSVGMIIEKIPASATTELTLENSLNLKGGYANQVGALNNGEQNLTWYILNSARKEIVDTFKITVSDDGKSAEVRATEITNSGNYYIVLESEEKDGTLKRTSLSITVKKPEMAAAIAQSMKNNTKEELKDKIEIFATGLDIGFYSKSAIDSESCAAIIEAEADTAALSNKAEVKKFVEKAIFIATLNKGTKTDLLLNSKGKISCVESLDLKKYDVDGVTIYKLFTDNTKYEYISNDGIKNILKSLKNQNFTNFTDFDEKILEEIVLNMIAYPGVYGTSYLDEVLTKENGEEIGLDMTKYLAYDDDEKAEKNEEIARNLYNKTELQTVLDEEPEKEGGSGGGLGGGFGGAPVKTGSDVKEPVVTPAPVVDDEVTNFTDVPDSHWAYADIYHLKELGVVSGVGYNTFLPDGTVTREQFIKMFVEAMDYDITAQSAGFSDVSDSDWYAPYIATAVNKGIITGISSDKFGVGNPVTRQDVCVIISRAMDNVDGSTEIYFDDEQLIDEYAKDAVSYLTSFNVIKGFADNTFRPKDYCTRAQVAKIICTILNMKGLVN